MKKIFIFAPLFILILHTSAQTNVPGDLKNFINGFQAAVLAHQYDSVLNYMDKTYREEQYEKFLSKNKVQFIDEFFGGYEDKKAEKRFVNVRLTEITAIKVYKMSRLSWEEYEVVFEIKRSSGKKYYSRCVLKRFENKLGFLGAVG